MVRSRLHDSSFVSGRQIIPSNPRENRGSSIVESPGATGTAQIPDLRMSMTANNMQSAGVVSFLDGFKLGILVFSVVLLIPFFLHRRIWAGGVGGHLFKRVRLLLISKGQAAGV